jgi:hypothetical protein
MDIKILDYDSMKKLKTSHIISLSNNLFHTHKKKNKSHWPNEN